MDCSNHADFRGQVDFTGQNLGKTSRFIQSNPSMKGMIEQADRPSSLLGEEGDITSFSHQARTRSKGKAKESGGFFKSWLWQGLKIGAPIGLGFLLPGLGFWAGTALMGASMGGMSLIEKLGTKGSLNSEDRVDLAVDFGTGFLGGALSRLPIFKGAKTYLSALFRGVASGGTSGAAMGGVGQMAKDKINHGEVDMGKALQSSATGFVGGAAFGGAFGSLGHHLKVRQFNHSTEPPSVNPPPTLARPPRGGGAEVITPTDSLKSTEAGPMVFPSLCSTVPTPKAVIPPPLPKGTLSSSTNKVSRKAIAFNRFEKKLQSQPGGDTPSSQDLLIRALKGKPLGEGATNAVYEIPGMPGYVLRIRKSLIPKVTAGQLSLKNLEMVPDCLPGRNIGQAIGKISYDGQKGFGGPEIQICKRQRGMPVGDMVRRYVVRKQSAGVPVTQTYDQIFYRKMNRMPQESFDQLARRINQIDRAGREIDSSHQYNLYISPKSKKFGWVDIERRMSPKKPGYNNTVDGMVMSVFGKPLGFPTDGSVIPTPAVRKQMISLMDKCLLAAQKEKLRFNSDFHKGPETYSVVKRMIIFMGMEKEWPTIHQQLVSGQFKGLPV